MLLECDRNEFRESQSTDAQTYDGPLNKNKAITPYLGPATIAATVQKSNQVYVHLPNGSYMEATMAVAGFYRPKLGDKVLVITQDSGSVYVIGVLEGAGMNTWSVPGDLVIQAPEGGISFECAGSMKMKSRENLEMNSPRLALRATRLEFSARRLVQKVDDAYLWVKGLFQVKSRIAKTVTEESFLVKTKRVRMKSEGDFNINGKTIHLG